MKTTIEMAREAAGDDWGLFQEFMPEIHRFAELVRADERARMAEQPAQQEPVAVPTTPYEHRKFVLVGRKWYERFAAFHDDCQIGERLTREEQTVRQQGYENGWNDAQRYLREPQASPPTQPQQEPVVIHQFRSPHCSDWYDGVPDHHDGYGPYEVRTLYTSPPAQQEPVATDWERIARVQDAKLRAMCNESGGFEKLCEVMDRYEHTSPQPAQQEPVAVWELFEDGWDSIADQEWMETLPVGTKLYTSPPAQRHWQGLTDQEIEQGCKESWVTEQAWQSAVWWAEAKLKEKNT